MPKSLSSFILTFLIGTLLIALFLFEPRSVSHIAEVLPAQRKNEEKESGAPIKIPTQEELIREARARSSNIKALYMTADVANDPSRTARSLRENIIRLAETTEINGLVIDVKEVCGSDYREAELKNLLTQLREKQIWTIARIVVFKDASQINAHPEWYLRRTQRVPIEDECSRKKYLRPRSKKSVPVEDTRPLWQDYRGGYWLDPASGAVQNYILEFSERMIDLGFDELQFDYIRFPADGEFDAVLYPVWDKKTPKYEVMKSFFEFLSRGLKAYKPDIILSADLFGYVALLPAQSGASSGLRSGDLGVGQRLEDIGDNFDYLSLMIYPSHYYHGFSLPEDSGRGLPAVSFNADQARAHPDIIVERSLLITEDFFEQRTATSGKIIFGSLPEGLDTQSPVRIRLRPWLEDFFHEEDRALRRPYGREKVRMQIDAAERAGASGWMLWNAGNIYTEEALRKE